MITFVGGRTSGLGSEGTRSHLQGRLEILATIGVLMSTALYAVVNALAQRLPGATARMLVEGTNRGHIATTLVMGALWLACRGKPRSTTTLRWLEGAAMALSGACFALVAMSAAPGQGSFLVAMGVTHALVGRALVVPSSAVRTALVGLVTALPAVVPAALAPSAPAAASAAAPTLPGGVMTVAWCVAAIAVSTTGSAVIYGLTRRVRAAMQLGQYTLTRKLGEGGMGAVYEAKHALLRRPTAVKLLPPDKAGLDAVARFEREVQQTARLCHPNTVAIYDYGHTPDGVFYYAMEYLDGLSLETLVEGHGPQRASRVVHILRQVAGALAEAHGKGLIHRDIKPANIMLCERGGVPDVVKVVDFGLVKSTGRRDAALTAQGLVGTPLYMPPEAITAPDSLDARSDLYSLGAVAYFLLTGEHVFSGSNVVEICHAHLSARPVRPSERVGFHVPEDLERVVLECLEKDPALRPASADALLAALDECEAAFRWNAREALAWWRERSERGDDRPTVRASRHQPTAPTMTVAMSGRSR